MRNRAGGGGGGIGGGDSIVRATDSIIAHNEATVGGGVYYVFGFSSLTHSAVSHNRASRDGGGIFAAAEAEMELINSLVISNEAGGKGGGIFSIGIITIVDLIDTLIANNKASDGGGLFTELGVSGIGDSPVTIEGTTQFRHNKPQDIAGVSPIIQASEPAGSVPQEREAADEVDCPCRSGDRADGCDPREMAPDS